MTDDLIPDRLRSAMAKAPPDKVATLLLMLLADIIIDIGNPPNAVDLMSRELKRILEHRLDVK